jgi:dienelactone hydrolase
VGLAVVDVRWHRHQGRGEFRITGPDSIIATTSLNSGSLTFPDGRASLPPHANLHYPCIENFVSAVADGAELLASGESSIRTDWVTPSLGARCYNLLVSPRQLAVFALIIAYPAHAQEPVSFPTRDGGLIQAHQYGEGDRAVVLAHGGRFNKESWAPQARILAEAGYRVLAFDFRGYGQSTGPGQKDIFTAPLHLDVLAAVHYLRKSGAKSVAAIGASLGGGAAASAATAEADAVDRLVLLGATPGGPPEKLKVRKLYIMTRDDTSGDGPRLPALRAHFAKAPEPKELILLEGSAHAQFMFETGHAARITREILRFLSAP